MKNLFNTLVAISTILILLSLILFNSSRNKLSTALFATFLTVWYHFFMRLIIGNVIGPTLLHVDSSNKWFRQTELENKLYKVLQVKDWKSFCQLMIQAYSI